MSTVTMARSGGPGASVTGIAYFEVKALPDVDPGASARRVSVAGCTAEKVEEVYRALQRDHDPALYSVAPHRRDGGLVGNGDEPICGHCGRPPGEHCPECMICDPDEVEHPDSCPVQQRRERARPDWNR